MKVNVCYITPTQWFNKAAQKTFFTFTFQSILLHHVILPGIKWDLFFNLNSVNSDHFCGFGRKSKHDLDMSKKWQQKRAHVKIVLLSAGTRFSSAALLPCLLPPQHQFLKPTQVCRFFFFVCRFFLTVQTFSSWNSTKRSRAPPCVVVLLASMVRGAPLASYSSSFSFFTLGWPGLACPLGSSVSLHPSLPCSDLSFCGSFFLSTHHPPFLPPLWSHHLPLCLICPQDMLLWLSC